MLATSVIKRLIRDEKVFEIAANIEMGKLEGMQTLDQALADLVRAQKVTPDDAISRSSNPRRLNELLKAPASGYSFEAVGSRRSFS